MIDVCQTCGIRYEIPEENLAAMSGGQRAVIDSMLVNHERLRFLIDSAYPPSKMPVQMQMVMKLKGIDPKNLWLWFVNQLAAMEPTVFDELVIELEHYTRKFRLAAVESDVQAMEKIAADVASTSEAG